jgi:hypothetical protein
LTDEQSVVPEPPLPGTGAVWVTPVGAAWSASWVEPGPPARDATEAGSWETAHLCRGRPLGGDHTKADPSMVLTPQSVESHRLGLRPERADEHFP